MVAWHVLSAWLARMPMWLAAWLAVRWLAGCVRGCLARWLAWPLVAGWLYSWLLAMWPRSHEVDKLGGWLPAHGWLCGRLMAG